MFCKWQCMSEWLLGRFFFSFFVALDVQITFRKRRRAMEQTKQWKKKNRKERRRNSRDFVVKLNMRLNILWLTQCLRVISLSDDDSSGTGHLLSSLALLPIFVFFVSCTFHQNDGRLSSSNKFKLPSMVFKVITERRNYLRSCRFQCETKFKKLLRVFVLRLLFFGRHQNEVKQFGFQVSVSFTEFLPQ